MYTGITNEIKYKLKKAEGHYFSHLPQSHSLSFEGPLCSETRHNRVCTEQFHLQFQAICRCTIILNVDFMGGLAYILMGTEYNDSLPLTAEGWPPSHSGC